MTDIQQGNEEEQGNEIEGILYKGIPVKYIIYCIWDQVESIVKISNIVFTCRVLHFGVLRNCLEFFLFTFFFVRASMGALGREKDTFYIVF